MNMNECIVSMREVGLVNALCPLLLDIGVDRPPQWAAFESLEMLLQAHQRAHHAGLFQTVAELHKKLASDAAGQGHFARDLRQVLPAKDRHVSACEVAFGENRGFMSGFCLEVKRKSGQLDGAQVDID